MKLAKISLTYPIVVISVALFAAQVASGAIHYVSPDGTGTGASWDD